MRIIGIDPGYERVGIAVLEKNAGMKREKLLYSDCFKTSSKLPFPARLDMIGTEIKKVIKEYEPEAMAIETLFFTNNQKTAMMVSQARGVIVYEGVASALSIYEYSPLEIKAAVAGYGRGDKKQVISMLQHLITIEKNIAHDDEHDAIAVALTCFASKTVDALKNQT